LVFLSYDEGKKSFLAGNAIGLLKKSGAPVAKPQGKYTSDKTVVCKIHEVKSDLNDNPKDKQLLRQKEIAEVVSTKYGDTLESVQVLSPTKRSAKKQSDLIRESLKESDRLGKSEIVVTTEKMVYLSEEEKKHAKYFKKGWVAKTYIGQGQFEEKNIAGIDKDRNKVLVKGLFGREKQCSPSQVLKRSGTRLYEKNTLNLAHNDRIRLNNDTKRSKQIGLSSNTSYIISIDKDKVTLNPINPRLKTIKATIKRLNGLDLDHDYVKTTSRKTGVRKESKQAILDSASYTLNKGLINELSRRYESIEIYTDNEKKAEKQIGIEAKKPIASELTFSSPETGKTPVQQAIAFGLSVVCARKAAFTYQSVIEKALDYDNATSSFSQIRGELINVVRSGDISARESATGEVLLATKETIALENSIIEKIKSGKNKVFPFMTKEDVDQKLQATNLTAGQKEACSLLASTKDRFVMIQGYAGTGKSTMLQTLKGVLEKSGGLSGDSIIALAPTHKAVKELQEKGTNAQTLKSFLVDNDPLDKSHTKQLEGKLVLLDESSMVSNRDFQSLQVLVEKAKSCHCAYIGDKAQLLSVEAGKPSELAYISKEAAIATATMDEVLRQKDPALKSVAHDLMASRTRSIEKAFNTLEEKGCAIEAEDPIKKLAKDYASLPVQVRQETVIAIATNKNRDLTNQVIREELISNGGLTGPELKTTRLTDSKLTKEQLAYSTSYKPGNVVKLNGSYFDLLSVDHALNTINLNDEGKAKAIDLGQMPKTTTLELFQKESMQVQVGDQLKWTKSDKDRGVTAHECLQVVGVDAQKGQVKAETAGGESIDIDLKQKQNKHIDYGYASTVHGLQGATSRSVMILMDAKNQKSNNMRLMYVAATRATHKATVYTNSLKYVKRQVSHRSGDKLSALEAMGLLDKKKNPTPKAAETKKEEAKTIKKKTNEASHKGPTKATTKRIDAKKVEESLRYQCRQVCEDTFGKRNESLSNATNWRYGRKGSLSVLVDGPHRGSFHNFETGEKGGMIQLLMSELGIDFKAALEQAQRMLGGDFTSPLPVKEKPNQKHIRDTGEEQKKRDYINSLIKKSAPITVGPGAKYLAGRGITNWENTDLREVKRVSTGGGNKQIRPFSSTLLSLARDKNGEVAAVQLTYLNPQTGEKIPELAIPKRTIGSLQGAFVQINTPPKAPQITFVAEGVETALSIKQSLIEMGKPSNQVVASLGKSNLNKISQIETASRIVLVLDNDKQDWRQDRMIATAISGLERVGKQVFCMQPVAINDEKTDYNDLSQRGLSAAIEKDVQSAIATFEVNEKVAPKSQTEKVANSKPVFDREIF
jgi:ATP-dependent exoDNAse (exonuclease V) alpha subunit